MIIATRFTFIVEKKAYTFTQKCRSLFVSSFAQELFVSFLGRDEILYNEPYFDLKIFIDL